MRKETRSSKITLRLDRKKLIKTFLFFALLTFLRGILFAHEGNRYQHKISTSVLVAISFGPNALGFKSGQNPLVVKTEKLLTMENINTSTVNAVVLGKRRTSDISVDIELEAVIQTGRLETKASPSQLDALLYGWEQIYEKPAARKPLNQKTKYLLYHDGGGFECHRLFKKDFEYLAFFNIAVDPVTRKVENRLSEIRSIIKFITRLEKDTRSRILLSNNTSGLPVYISISNDGKDAEFEARIPMHAIAWSAQKGFQKYTFISSLDRVRNIPEIKRLLKESSVIDFVTSQKDSVRVNVKGNQNQGFSCIFIGDGLGRNLVVKIVGKRIELKKDR